MDVLIADIDMPGMKGTDLAQQATERWPHLRVLLVSGGAADVGRVRATGVYQITQPLPSEEDTFRYRIKDSRKQRGALWRPLFLSGKARTMYACRAMRSGRAVRPTTRPTKRGWVLGLRGQISISAIGPDAAQNARRI